MLTDAPVPARRRRAAWLSTHGWDVRSDAVRDLAGSYGRALDGDARESTGKVELLSADPGEAP